LSNFNHRVLQFTQIKWRAVEDNAFGSKMGGVGGPLFLGPRR
jgi:hypothetical protein